MREAVFIDKYTLSLIVLTWRIIDQISRKSGLLYFTLPKIVIKGMKIFVIQVIDKVVSEVPDLDSHLNS